eukprot:m.637554 g.637554  ORF g.637554 m.637554 type:complete len:100 (-) comp22602_c0_seq3:1353-1652(-)
MCRVSVLHCMRDWSCNAGCAVALLLLLFVVVRRRRQRRTDDTSEKWTAPKVDDKSGASTVTANPLFRMNEDSSVKAVYDAPVADHVYYSTSTGIQGAGT